MSHSILMVLTPFYATCLPNLLIFQEPLTVETQNKHHWIWHASNSKYVPHKPFQCIIPSQNKQNVKFVAVCLHPSDNNGKEIHLYRVKCSKKLVNLHI